MVPLGTVEMIHATTAPRGSHAYLCTTLCPPHPRRSQWFRSRSLPGHAVAAGQFAWYEPVSAFSEHPLEGIRRLGPRHDASNQDSRRAAGGRPGTACGVPEQRPHPQGGRGTATSSTARGPCGVGRHSQRRGTVLVVRGGAEPSGKKNCNCGCGRKSVCTTIPTGSTRKWGFCHVRLQTWLPYHVCVCSNGRAILARHLDQVGVAYRRRDNCFTAVADRTQAQALADAQVRWDWSARLQRLLTASHPAWRSWPGMDRD
jgi:hypothetical protein